ncbi:Peptidase family M48 [Selenomonas ruminantium]|uniref:Peptidase family M48 n=1 Tax=Selenomonas ruminantium TaxID=971 RepID=A0A1M6R5G9_SELRU|nr:M48 family metallopeptidase [Selenomonas ruminantium]SHK27693.1 Peptidase family M48 [Selenomonas ruminantium]
MNKKLKTRITTGLTALCLTIPLTLGAPAPRAEAGFDLSNIAGALIGGAAAHSQLNNELHKYNDTEQGRQEMLQHLKKQYGVNHDPYLNNQLDRIMHNLTTGIAAVDPSVYKKPYNYFINNEKTFNAFCTLGHNLSVNTGLYSVLQNEDEIAVVLAHELGHGQKDHPVKGARRALNVEIVGAATGSQAGQLMAAVVNNRHITKPMEREADALAFDYISHTGYNPGACAAVWQRVMDRSKGQPSSFQKFLSDHPANDDRRDAYAKRLNQYSNGHVTNKDGVIKVNTKVFCTPAAAGGMSAQERAYFVMGNLAAAYHNGHNTRAAYTEGNTVMLGQQPIITCTSGDESASVLAERLNKIK